ncbi:MAG: biotin--[acetyl-CoA-carboxylase] ligase [Acidobacteria bacterium]|nr:biotin--[acetyl-CoA-carboxylase] ligase [Acidobacteriota bacterium]
MAFNVEHVRARLPGRAIVWFPSLDSTMEEAARLGVPGGVVVAGGQTAGQGRFGRRWHSEAGAGVYASLVLRPRAVAPSLTLALGLAAAEAIAKAAGLACDLRWPNDVLIGGRKCAGILVQVHGESLVAGIGINVNQTAFPDEIAPLATSLRLAGGRETAHEDLLIALLESVDRHVEILDVQGPGAVLDLFAAASSYARGRRVTVDLDGTPIQGTTDGLDQAGFLWLRAED